jgi:hypothetical protein
MLYSCAQLYATSWETVSLFFSVLTPPQRQKLECVTSHLTLISNGMPNIQAPLQDSQPAWCNI